MSGEKYPAFQINTGSQNFADRQKNLFQQLDLAESNTKDLLKNHEIICEKMDDDVPQSVECPSDLQMKKFCGRESIFKKPQRPISKCLKPARKMPDFQRNPHKWTKYSLEDVSNEDMSDKSNTAAAMSFLKEIGERKQQESDESMDTNSLKITFNKRSIKRTTADLEENKSVFQNNKLVMPEYVVGQKVHKNKKPKQVLSTVGKQLKLDHLIEDDDIE